MVVVFKATNRLDGKVFIGRTGKPLDDYWFELCNSAFSATNTTEPLLRAIWRNGRKVFDLEMLEETDVDHMAEVTKKYIAEYKSSMPSKGYNYKCKPKTSRKLW